MLQGGEHGRGQHLPETSKVSIDVGVLGLRGLGKADPVADCTKAKARKKKIACMAKDRRVEIEFEFKE